MRRFLVAAVLILIATIASAQQQDLGLPELHKINSATLSPSYSCRSSDDFKKGYENTALFLSAFSKRRNSPDLLFNGACGSQDYFQASTAGDDMALIADLGAVTIEEMTAHRAFNVKGVHNFKAYSKFSDSVKVVPGHTYAVLLSKSEIRGLFIFTVDNYIPNQRVDLRYAVKQYQVLTSRTESVGFDWERKNQQD
jgi:hypothetical protein